MARTSNRRWKGCQMCKPHKHAANGDSYRQPVQVQREMGSSKRWNRHDVDVAEAPKSRKKNTRKWCRGKVGVEHDAVVVKDRHLEQRACEPPPEYPRGYRAKFLRNTEGWQCFHHWECANCGKHLHWLDARGWFGGVGRENCPDAP